MNQEEINKLKSLFQADISDPNFVLEYWKDKAREKERRQDEDDIAPPQTRAQRTAVEPSPQPPSLNAVYKYKGDIAKQLYKMAAPEYKNKGINQITTDINNIVQPARSMRGRINNVSNNIQSFNANKKKLLQMLGQIRKSETNQQGLNRVLQSGGMTDLMQKLGIDEDIKNKKFPFPDLQTNYDRWKIKSGQSDAALNAIKEYLDNKEAEMVDRLNILQGAELEIQDDLFNEALTKYAPPKSLNLQMQSGPMYARLATPEERARLQAMSSSEYTVPEADLQEEYTNTERPELDISRASSVQKEQSKPDLDLSDVSAEYERLRQDAEDEDEDEDEDERPELKDPADEVSTLNDAFKTITNYQEYLDPKAFADLAKNVRAMQDYITEISVLSASKGASAGKIAGAREKFEEIKSTVRKNLQNSYKQIMDKLNIYKDAVSAEDALISEIKSLASYEQYTQLPPAIFEQLPEDIKKKCLYLMES